MAEPAATVVVPSLLGGERLRALLSSLQEQTAEHRVIVVDNGSGGAVVAAATGFPGVDVISLPANQGFAKAVNRGVEAATTAAVVFVNDDCVCDPAFVGELLAALDPDAGVPAVAGVLRDSSDPGRIDSAGVEIDRALLGNDYLNGEPLSVLGTGVPDPAGPTGGAAAYDRKWFLDIGGFDEALFAYWEDVDLALRLRASGARCRLAPRALATHAHSATLGSGSARKNYLMGFGRGYVLSKWGGRGGRRLAGAIARDSVILAGQAMLDHNLAGVRGRIAGYRRATGDPLDPGPLPTPPGTRAGFGGRLMRRRRLRRRTPAANERGPVLAFLHLAGPSGPLRSLEPMLSMLARDREVVLVVPDEGSVDTAATELGEVRRLPYEAVMLSDGVSAALAYRRQRRAFQALIRELRPSLAITATALMPMATRAAAREGIPLIVCGSELLAGSHRGGLLRRGAGEAVARLTARSADAIVACSDTVAAQYRGKGRARVETIYPPVSPPATATGKREARSRIGVEPDLPLVLSVGAMTAGRGQDVLVRAIGTLAAGRAGLRCCLVGAPHPRPQDQEFAATVDALIDELGLGEVVTRHDDVDDVGRFLAAADVVVNPAKSAEGFGRVAFEAAVRGVPCVSSAVGAVPEVLEDGRSALLVPPGDVTALATAIDRVLGDPKLGAALADEAARFAREQLDPGAASARFEALAGSSAGAGA